MAEKFWVIVISVLCCAPYAVLRGGEAGDIDFSSQIKPILSDNCYACHGPDASKRKAGLRLDNREGVLEVHKKSGRAAVVPGNIQSSHLIDRILSDDPDDVMPPADSGKLLTSHQKDLLTRWVANGAPWEDHWSFKPIQRPTIPQPAPGTPIGINPVDAFIRARLEKEKFQPSPQADRHTLIRRVTFDLTGLPPTWDEVQDFVHDESPDAWEDVIDRLLKSAHFGEHMARYWLDAARYGDTHGLHLDNYREIWPYRDWVIRAFNENLPYDEFIRDQLAGDLLPDPTMDQLVATGFNRCHVTTSEGGSIEEEIYVRNVIERVVATGTVFMGLTMDCTRCHDHKFDPLTMKDFYSLFGYFNNLDGSPLDGNSKTHAPVIKVPSSFQSRKLESIRREIAALKTQLKGPWATLDQLQDEWVQSLRNPDAQLIVQPGLSAWYHVGPFPENRQNQLQNNQGPEGKPVQLDEVFTSGDGRKLSWIERPSWLDGQVHTDLQGDMAANFLYRSISVPASQKLTLSLGSDDGIKVYLNGELKLNRDVSRGPAPDQEILSLELKEGSNHLLLKIMNFGGATGFYFALPDIQKGIPEAVLSKVSRAQSEWSPEEEQMVRDYFRDNVCLADELKSLRATLAQAEESLKKIEEAIPTTLIWKERSDLRPSYILKRGEYDQRGDEVPRLTPAILPPMRDEWPNNRLGLAQWLVADEHPLTARVAVNRIWQQIFGTGIVKTSEDFGSQGEPPSHPLLLDWLADAFRQSNWDVKQLVKILVTSETYCQESAFRPDHLSRDPGNRLLARGPPLPAGCRNAAGSGAQLERVAESSDRGSSGQTTSTGWALGSSRLCRIEYIAFLR
ncbi:MAG: PSD1 and planctomycete cytochrome C domain-containing protein [Verrucomicrobia bacterium]|nr:PSD1 and planctomycete cytochrome C domain-containing protein [Verrucomicrobiota bacterium]